jgi:hypothetical protein
VTRGPLFLSSFVGDRIDGVLEWPHGLRPIEFKGMVARVGPGDVAVTFHKGLIPFAYFRS